MSAFWGFSLLRMRCDDQSLCLQVFKSDVPRALNILADMLTAPKLDEAAIERERGVILREMEEVNQQQVCPDTIHRSLAWKHAASHEHRNDPQEEVIFDLLHETAYQGSGLGRTILGPESNIKTISKKHLEDYIKTHYTGPRIVVAGAGAIDHTQLTQLADKAFGALPSAPRDGLVTASQPAVFVGSDIRQRDDDLPLAHMAIAVETGGWTNPHAFPLMIMQVRARTAPHRLCSTTGTESTAP